MKKLLCGLLALLMLTVPALAEVDLSGMSLEELRSLRDQIDAEILARGAAEAGEVIKENDRCKIVLASAAVEGRTITLTIEWTNLSEKTTDLHWHLDAQAFADGVSINCRTDGFYTEIRPGVTYTATVQCTAPATAKQVNIDLMSWLGTATYKTYTFDMR